MKIAILKIGALGDWIMASPLIASVVSSYPQATIDCWIGSPFKDAVQYMKGIRCLAFDPDIFYKHRFWKLPGLIKDIRAQHYDMVFVLDKHWIFGFTAWLCRIPARIGFDRAGAGWMHTKKVVYGRRMHETAYYLELAKAGGCTRIVKRRSFSIPAAAVKNAQRIAKKYHLMNACAIAPGGAKNAGQDMPSRRWPVQRFAELIQKLPEQVILLGSKEDKAITDAFAASSCTNLAGRLSLLETAALLRKCKGLITNDAGLMHVAAAVGCPVVAIFGPTDPVRKAPKGARIAWHPMKLDKEEVFARYSEEAKKNIKKVTVREVLSLWQTI